MLVKSNRVACKHTFFFVEDELKMTLNALDIQPESLFRDSDMSTILNVSTRVPKVSCKASTLNLRAANGQSWDIEVHAESRSGSRVSFCRLDSPVSRWFMAFSRLFRASSGGSHVFSGSCGCEVTSASNLHNPESSGLCVRLVQRCI